VFSSQIPVGFINYKGVRNPEFQEISRIKTKPVECGTRHPERARHRRVSTIEFLLSAKRDAAASRAWVVIGCKRTVRVLFSRSGTRSTSVRKSCRTSERASSRPLIFSRAKLGEGCFNPARLPSFSPVKAVKATATKRRPAHRVRVLVDRLGSRAFVC
jgi:hypothetical protein